MGNIDTSMGYVVNDDGSITRINSAQHQSSRSPNFIPVSLSKYSGSTKRFWFFLAFIVIFLVHMIILFFGTHAYHEYDWSNSWYKDYIYYRDEGDKESADDCYNLYEQHKENSIFLLGFAIASLLGSIVVDCKEVPRLRRTYPGKKMVLKGVEYIQSNLGSNHRYPYIMTNNLIGVLSIRKGKIIISPNYDDIRWVIPKKVFCAERQGKKTFYDINGNTLQNVPQSYYNC